LLSFHQSIETCKIPRIGHILANRGGGGLRSAL
jgi:hypothetical protein